MATTYEPIEYDPTKYVVNYNDPRFTAVKEEEASLLQDAKDLYGERASGVDKAYEGLKEATQQWADTQTAIQNQQTNQIISELKQQQEYAEKDYQKEQAGAYVDWQKQSNQYGVGAEKMAAAGLDKTGYAESSQVSMFNAYQNRVAVARESFQRTCDNFANAIAEAKIQNNAALAEIALTALEKSAEYDLQAFLHKDQLLSELFDREMQIKQFSSDKWYKELEQVNLENNRQFQYDQQQNEFAFTANENQLNRDFEAEQAKLEREWKEAFEKEMAEIEQGYAKELAKIEQDYNKELAKIEQDYKLAYLKAETKAEKEIADHKHQLALQKLGKEYEYEKKLKAQELADAKEKAKHQAQLELANAQAMAKTNLANEKSLYSYKADVDASKKQTTFTGNTGNKSSYKTVTSAPVKKGTAVQVSTSSVRYNNKPVNMDSITALGYGPLNSKQLATKIGAGLVSLVLKNGEYYAVKNAPNFKTFKQGLGL